MCTGAFLFGIYGRMLLVGLVRGGGGGVDGAEGGGGGFVCECTLFGGLGYLQVFSINAPYVSENPISRSHMRAVHVYTDGGA